MSSSSNKNEPQLAVGGETDHGIELPADRAQLVHDVRELFCSRPTLEILKKWWAPDAVFEDPIAIAKGYDQYSAQWFGMPKAFPKSETLAWKVTRNEPSLIEYEQRQKYTIAGIKTTKEMLSLVHIELGQDGKITKLEDRWNGNPLPQGSIAKTLRNFNAQYFVPTFVSVPKEDK
ncbi:hypothetical protein OIO90_004223 [Microbotryomycetes sp. JL221]|nr:hypothetical protein OIO90_004223 [Microbotryomycetes sp. JL221]